MNKYVRACIESGNINRPSKCNCKECTPDSRGIITNHKISNHIRRHEPIKNATRKPEKFIQSEKVSGNHSF